jgi:hypothetical protein
LVGQRQPQIYYYKADGLASVSSLTHRYGSGGGYVQQYRAQLQAIASATGVDDLQVGSTTGAFQAIVGSNGPIDFKNKFRGKGSATTLAQAGNFAYYAIGAGILPNFELDAVLEPTPSIQRLRARNHSQH